MSQLFRRNDPSYTYTVAKLNEEEYVIQQNFRRANSTGNANNWGNADYDPITGAAVQSSSVLMEETTNQNSRRPYFWGGLLDGYGTPARFASLQDVQKFVDNLFLKPIANINFTQNQEVSVTAI